MRKAFKVAQTEKPGATHLELPEDVAAETVSDGDVDGPLLVQAPSLPEPLARQVNRAVEVLAQARRPILLVGNGVIRGQAHEAVRRFARQANVPVVHTFMSKGVVPDSDPLSLYTIGLQMRDHSAVVVEQSDVVVAVGYDFVEYAPCLWNQNRDKHIVHVDVSPAEVDTHYIVDVGVLGDIALSLDQIGGQLAPFNRTWTEESRQLVQTAYEKEWAQPPEWPLAAPCPSSRIRSK